MSFPAGPTPSYYATVTQSARNGVYYQSDANNTTPAPPTFAWKIGSVPIRSGH